MKYIRHYLVTLACCMLALVSCKDDWDDRSSLLDQNLSDKDLLESIDERSDLSIFKQILTLTGYWEYLSSSRDITVLTIFAPTDAAFQAQFDAEQLVKEEFLADIDGLKSFLDRHIANTMHIVELSIDPYRVKMWDGRRLELDPREGSLSLDEDIEIETPNLLCKNGVIHTISDIVPDREDVWTTAKGLLTSAGDPLQLLNAITRFDYRMMDSTSQINGYVDDKPTYDTIWLDYNRILDYKDISNEDTIYTYVVLQDEGYIPLAAKYGKIYKRLNAAESDSLIVLNLNLDLIFPGKLKLTTAGAYETVTGINVDLDPSNLVAKYRASNGYVYVMRTASITFRNNKVKDVIVEGENTDYRDANFNVQGRSATLIDGDTFLRGKLWRKKYRTWASNNMVLNVGGNYRAQGVNYYVTTIGGDRQNFFAMFTKARPNVFSVPYEFYWRMGNDFEKDSSRMIAQRIYLSGPEALQEVRMMESSNLRVMYNEILSADTLNAYPDDTYRGTYAFFGSIQDSMRYNYWLNNEWINDTIDVADVVAYMADNFQNYFDYVQVGGLATPYVPGSTLPVPGDTVFVGTDPTTLDTLICDYQFVRDCYMNGDYDYSNMNPQVAYVRRAPNGTDVAGYYIGAIKDPNSGWMASDYYTLAKWPNREQPMYKTYAYANGDYDTWQYNKEDGAANRFEFTSYGSATLMVTRNFTGIASTESFQQNCFIAVDYIRLQPNLDDIDE